MTKEGLLALTAQRYDELQQLNKLDNFYDYEKLFVKIWGNFFHGWPLGSLNIFGLSYRLYHKHRTIYIELVSVSVHNTF
jgi:hypothetical protein